MDQASPSMAVRAGRFLFLRRNELFPILLIALFGAFSPASSIFGSVANEALVDYVALIVVVFGMLIRVIVIGYTAVGRQGINKEVSANQLQTKGLFGVCRNPLYVGNFLIAAGLFLIHGNIIVVAVGLVVTLLIYNAIIANEESFLLDKFGDEYQAYKNSTNRWLPKLSRLGSVWDEHTFRAKLAIKNEYTVGVAAALVAAILFWYEASWVGFPTISVFLLVFCGIYLLAGKVLVRL